MINPKTLPMIRGAQRLFSRRVPPDIEVLTLPSGAGVRLHRPAFGTGPGPAVLWIHGGGYLIGTPAQDDAACRVLARELGATVAAVRYRLAPEFPYPSSLEDCYSVLTWLHGLPAVDPERIAIAGASAGGGLAAALALLARDRAEVPVASQLLVYPMLDDRSSDRVGEHDSKFRLWTRSSNRYGWRSYLGDADPNVAVPARRQDLSGLPQAWIGVGTFDLFHDEDLEYAERLRAAGVPCDVEVVEGAFHGFDGIAAKAPVSRAFFGSQLDFLRRTLTQTETAGA
ncbi:alpha/beta hydrolase [Mycolicibacterium arenosum]|uniref:Alpha/beta hydrolase n=1 Tax=Mycolicibacterium arenosum TaxID=2952157 RepID=A0ABT1LZM5_9MYCO|nr:alpha/beta hydrolase [Mycolicibacterium sp. CAU 1645]MCP9272359.1 alpha/beta hydrolase [Mycolicibacterium sp. CAU 1645]